VTLENLVGRAADAAQLDPLGALGLGVFDNLRFLGHGHDHLGKHRLMAVHDDVDMVFLHHAQVGFGLQRIGGPEEDILEIGGQHGAAPAVRQGSAGALLGDVLVILVHTHVGAVHDLDDFPVDIPGLDALGFPFFVQRFRRPFQIQELAFGLTPLIAGFLAYFQGDFVHIAILRFTVHFNGGGYAQMRRDRQQFVHIFDLIGFGLFPGRGKKNLGHTAAVVGMGGSAGSHHAREVTGGNGVGGGPAQALAGVLALDPALGQRYAAGSHGTVLTANALHADVAGFHLYGSVKNRFNIQCLSTRQHLLGADIHRCLYRIRDFGFLHFFIFCHNSSSIKLCGGV